MTAEQPPDGPDLRSAARAGARRATYHLIKAGWEVLAGVGAFLEEVRRAGQEPDASAAQGPQRIVLDDDEK